MRYVTSPWWPYRSRRAKENALIRAARAELASDPLALSCFMMTVRHWRQLTDAAEHLTELVGNPRYSCPPATGESLIEHLEFSVKQAKKARAALKTRRKT